MMHRLFDLDRFIAGCAALDYVVDPYQVLELYKSCEAQIELPAPVDTRSIHDGLPLLSAHDQVATIADAVEKKNATADAASGAPRSRGTPRAVLPGDDIWPQPCDGTWRDSAGVTYDASAHAWNRAGFPAVTPAGRFRAKRGTGRAPTVPPAAPLEPPAADQAPAPAATLPPVPPVGSAGVGQHSAAVSALLAKWRERLAGAVSMEALDQAAKICRTELEIELGREPTLKWLERQLQVMVAGNEEALEESAES